MHASPCPTYSPAHLPPLPHTHLPLVGACLAAVLLLGPGPGAASWVAPASGAEGPSCLVLEPPRHARDQPGPTPQHSTAQHRGKGDERGWCQQDSQHTGKEAREGCRWQGQHTHARYSAGWLP